MINDEHYPKKAANRPGDKKPPHRHICQLRGLVPAKLGEVDSPLNDHPRENQPRGLTDAQQDMGRAG